MAARGVCAYRGVHAHSRVIQVYKYTRELYLQAETCLLGKASLCSTHATRRSSHSAAARQHEHRQRWHASLCHLVGNGTACGTVHRVIDVRRIDRLSFSMSSLPT